MNTDVLTYARSLLLETKWAHNSPLAVEAVSRVRQMLPQGVIPSWYCDLLTTVPLAGRYLEYRGREGTVYLQWLDADGIVSECDAFPGVVAIGHRYCPVAACPDGSGDPYFICAMSGEDPSLWQLFHDMSNYILTDPRRAMRLVSQSLAELFSNSRVIA